MTRNAVFHDAGTFDDGSPVDIVAASGLTAHLADTSAAHAASAISYAGGTGMSATDVEAAIDELATEKTDAANPITSGALPTQSFTSGTAAQVSTSRAVSLIVPVTFNPTALLTSTCLVQLSADNSTYSTLVTKTVPALAGLVGLVDEVTLHVPKSWWVKLTATNATLGTGTYY